jgi:hypothetical protein
MLFTLYTEPASELEREECRVLSAVRVGDMRPLDKALHSALVAVPTMYLEHLLGLDELEIQYFSSLVDCTTGLVERQRFFSGYGWQVVTDLASFVRTRDYAGVTRSLDWSDAMCTDVSPALDPN